MPNLRTNALLTLAFAAATLDTPAVAQDVILSEVGLAASGGYVELHNRGAVAADVSPWSIYLATATPNLPRNYWWGFRPGTVIPAGGFLVVRWLQPLPQQSIAGEEFTGATVPYFLFGLGAEALPQTQGAVALVRSQTSSAMNSSSVLVDWVGWGGNGFPREDLAIQAGLWRSGSRAPSLSMGTSLARHPAMGGGTRPELAWFVDATPTPGQDNVGAAALATLAQPCAPTGHQLLGLPDLLATSLPVLGNGAFGLAVDDTTGVFTEWVVVALTTDALPFPRNDLLPPAPGGDLCTVAIDPSTTFATFWLHTSMLRTNLPLSFASLPAGLAGQSFCAQALVFDAYASAWPPYKGITNGLRVTIGN